jgi:hypothetical protein
MNIRQVSSEWVWFNEKMKFQINLDYELRMLWWLHVTDMRWICLWDRINDIMVWIKYNRETK